MVILLSGTMLAVLFFKVNSTMLYDLKLWGVEHGLETLSCKNPVNTIKKSPCFQNVGNVVLT